MSDYPQACWNFAKESMRAAIHVLPVSPAASASRAYYAAFYAVSAFFAVEGRKFKKHTAVQTAVHRDLVRKGLWTKELGAAFTDLLGLRDRSDYDIPRPVSVEEAKRALVYAEQILRAVSALDPTRFGSLDGAFGQP